MEAVFYNHASEDAALRRADLRRALQSFLADAASCAAVRLIGLFVRIPTPSTMTAVTSTASSNLKSTTGPSTTPPSKAVPLRRRGAQKLTWCALEADRRLRQASEDAAELNRWLVHGTLAAEQHYPRSMSIRRHHGSAAPSSFSPSLSPVSVASAQVHIVVVAYLDPQAREDLIVYESWQRCAEATPTGSNNSNGASVSRTTRRLSPLRNAVFVALSLGAPPLLLSWTERSSRCFLSSLLLPHQSLLFDMSWCITASLAGNVEVTGSGLASKGGGGRVTGQVLFDLFTQDVLPSLRFPKGDSRSAFWLSYSSLMAALHPSVFFGGNNADLNLAAHASHEEWQRSKSHTSGNAEVFAKTHRLIRQVFTALFQSSSGGSNATAPGRTQSLRVVLGYGGLVSTLQRQLIHVTGAARHGSALNFAATAADAALLRTRNLVDVYALFGVLAGHDRTDFYAAAAAFVRTATRRWATATGNIRKRNDCNGVHALESTLVQVMDAGDNTTGTAATARMSNTFVEAGARALARRRAQLERRRLGKGKAHFRERDRAARVHKRLLKRKARQVVPPETVGTTNELTKAGKKRRADEANGVPFKLNAGIDSRTAASSDAAPTKKVKGEASTVPAAVKNAAGETLSWCVDLG